MDTPRRPTVTPPLQLAALGQTPVHDDPTVRLAGVIPQPLSHRGDLWQPPSPAPNWRQSVLVHPTVYIAPQPRIGDQTGDQSEIANEPAVTYASLSMGAQTQLPPHTGHTSRRGTGVGQWQRIQS